VYGTASAELRTWCQQHDLPLHESAWRSEYNRAGLAQDAVYLLRPDTYVAFADTAGSADALEAYFGRRRIRP
jgi:hypothetical protein